MERPQKTSRLEKETLSPSQRIIRHFFELHKPTEQVVRFGHEQKTSGEMSKLEQSLSEHVHGMAVLADLILDADPAAKTLDRARIHTLIRYHDAHEVITGDVIIKNDSVRKEEAAAEETITHLEALRGNEDIETLLAEYHAQETPEARFVKGIDRLEAYLTMMYAGRAEKLNNRITDAQAIADMTRTVSPLLADTQKLVLRFLMHEKSAQKEFDFIR